MGLEKKQLESRLIKSLGYRRALVGMANLFRATNELKRGRIIGFGVFIRLRFLKLVIGISGDCLIFDWYCDPVTFDSRVPSVHIGLPSMNCSMQRHAKGLQEHCLEY